MQIRSHPWFVNNMEKYRKKEEQNTPRTQRYQQHMKKNSVHDHVNPKEIKINPSIVLEMIEKYKIPVNPIKNSGGETEQFSIDNVLKSLALNKHNDSTTTYYLLHKKWMNHQARTGPAR
jgi:hypothetical protein